jgi:drug/metabolite transporter (DMT)-like permease
VIGIAGNVLPFALINWGEIRIDSGLAAILIGTMPIFTVLIAHRFTRDERLSRDKLIGIAIGFAGLAVLVGPGALAGLGGDIAAELAVCAAAASYAATAVYSRKLARVFSPEVTAAGSIIAGAAIALPLSLAFDRPWALAPSGQALAAIAALAVLSTALAAVIFFHLLASAGATFTALSNYLIPLSGLLWGVLFLAERPSLNALLALAMILVAAALVGHGAPKLAGREGRRGRAAETRS